jgi:hypothetical protein
LADLTLRPGHLSRICAREIGMNPSTLSRPPSAQRRKRRNPNAIGKT